MGQREKVEYDDAAEAEIARLLANVKPSFPAASFTVRGVRTLPGGATCQNGDGFSEGDFRDARRVADELQSQFDDDCDPVRVYVFDANDVPVYAGCARVRHHRRDIKRGK